MIRLAAAALLLLAGGAQDQAIGQAAHWAQLTVQERIIIRVPSRPRAGAAAASPVTQWRETGAPRCLQAGQIAAANIGDRSIDFIMRDNSRVRARLGRRCEGLNYYRGFYLDQPRDGRICAERDVIRSRMGGQCDITEFRTLQPPSAPRARRP